MTSESGRADDYGRFWQGVLVALPFSLLAWFVLIWVLISVV